MTKPGNGEAWLANLNPGRGAEPGKMRPVLIVQGQALLDAGHPSTLVVPLTTNLMNNTAPLRLRVPARERLDQDSDLLIDQLRAIDNRRLTGGPLARLPIAAMRGVYRAIADVLEIPYEALNLAPAFRRP
jgi:mRNA interferase MazF